MKIKELKELGEIALKKYEGKHDLTEFKETIRRLGLLSPADLNKEMEPKKAKKAIRLLRKLGVNYIELAPDVSLTSY